MAKKISVIVPVYNTEKYLVNCLTYLVNQSLEDIEIICVNDCSTDNSPAILASCASQYPDKVKIINMEKNSGPGGARNAGLKAATGEYIGFVDSDDQIDVSMYEKLYNKAVQGNYDIVDCAFHEQKSGNNCLVTVKEYTEDLDKYKRTCLVRIVGYIYTKIIKRKLIVDNNVFFREKIIYEDVDFMCMLYLLAERVGNVEEVLYIYRYTKGSTSRQFDDRDKSLYEFKELIINLYKRLKDLKHFDEVREAVEEHTIKNYSYIIMGVIGSGTKKYKCNLKKELTEISSLVKEIAGDYYNKPYAANLEGGCIEYLKMNDKSSENFLRFVREING